MEPEKHFNHWIYVDDCLVIGKEMQINQLTTELKENGFNLKIENNLKDFLSCRMIKEKDMNQIMILQPHLINNLQAKFREEVEKQRVNKSPGTPRFKIVCPNDEDDTIDVNVQSRYRSGVGKIKWIEKLLYCKILFCVNCEILKC
jgi:hypothetical protein